MKGYRMKKVVCVVFALLQYVACVEFDILKVGQANCTIIKYAQRVLMYDCGYSGGGWLCNQQLAFDKKCIFDALTSGVKYIGIHTTIKIT